MMSMSTTSASSLEAIQWAAVAPTFPEPTTVTFLRMRVLSITDQILYHGEHGGTPGLFRCRRYCCAHVLDDVAVEFTGFDLLGPFHQALEVISHSLLLDGALQALLD